MKNIFILLTALGIAATATAQPIITGCVGTSSLGIVNGTTYTKTGTLGSGGYSFVSASQDGSKFYASAVTASKLFYIDVSSSTFIDSMNIYLRNIVSSNEPDRLFGLSAKALIRVNTTSKSVVDSVQLGEPFQLEERPNAKEVWVSDSGKVHVIDYTSGLTVTTIPVSPSAFDYSIVRFSPGGTMAFKSANNRKKLFKIDPVTKTLIDSVSTAPYGHSALAVSHDSTKIFACDAGNSRIRIFRTSDLVLIDSIDCGTRAPMNIYRHPYRAEMWAVNHFRDSVSVYNENTFAQVAAFNISSSPWYLAFGNASLSVSGSVAAAQQIAIFPNPASNSIVINVPDNATRTAILYDNAGRVVGQYAINSMYQSIDVSDLASGNYYLTIVKDNKIQTTLKWVKQ